MKSRKYYDLPVTFERGLICNVRSARRGWMRRPKWLVIFVLVCVADLLVLLSPIVQTYRPGLGGLWFLCGALLPACGALAFFHVEALKVESCPSGKSYKREG